MSKKDNKNATSVWLAITRVLLGFTFFWAFVDKLFGFGIATPAERAWINGGSPTTGFLKNVEGPFADFFNGMSGQVWVDWLFMAGLFAIGLALLLGVALRLAAWSGALLMVLMWAASLPLENNPFVDDHVVYATVLLALGAAASQQRYGLGGWWQDLSVVKKNSWLQ